MPEIHTFGLMRMDHIWRRDRRILKGIFGARYVVSKIYFLHYVLSFCLFTFNYAFSYYISPQARTKLLSAVLSLPVPSKSSYFGEQVSSQISRSFPDYIEQRTLQKLLLVGYNGSGTSTIFKQVLLNGELQFLNLLWSQFFILFCAKSLNLNTALDECYIVVYLDFPVLF